MWFKNLSINFHVFGTNTDLNCFRLDFQKLVLSQFKSTNNCGKRKLLISYSSQKKKAFISTL